MTFCAGCGSSNSRGQGSAQAAENLLRLYPQGAVAAAPL